MRIDCLHTRHWVIVITPARLLTSNAFHEDTRHSLQPRLNTYLSKTTESALIHPFLDPVEDFMSADNYMKDVLRDGIFVSLWIQKTPRCQL